MPRYLSLINFTDEGIRSVGKSLDRAEHFKAAVTAAGGNVEAVYWAVGDADGAVIFDAPDDATGAALLLKLGRDGFVRTKTLTIFDSTEFRALVSSI